MTDSSLTDKWQKADRLERGGILLVVGALFVFASVFTFKKVSFALEAKRRTTDVDAGPHVEVANVTPSAPQQTVSMLGEARPYVYVTHYAKVSGYLREVHADKGDLVESGQWLARIESPKPAKITKAPRPTP